MADSRSPSDPLGGSGSHAGRSDRVGPGDHSRGSISSQALERAPALLVDAMLGRLARWLRLLGYDALYAQDLGPGHVSDHQIAARARTDGRVVLTRDRELARRKGVRCLLVRSQILEEQLQEVVAALGRPPPGAPARCTACNAPLVEISPAEARPRVPPYVFRTQRCFHRCPACERLYWPGSHWRRVQSTFQRVLEGDPKGLG